MLFGHLLTQQEGRWILARIPVEFLLGPARGVINDSGDGRKKLRPHGELQADGIGNLTGNPG